MWLTNDPGTPENSIFASEISQNRTWWSMPDHPNERSRPGDANHRANDPNDDRYTGQLEALHQAIVGDHSSGELSGSDRASLSKLAAEIPGGKVLEIIERVRAAERSKNLQASETEHATPGSTHRAARSASGSPIDELPLTIGRFQIRRQLGQGGFGLVMLAFDPQLDREIALKIPQFKALATADSRERFLREGRAAASLNHVNIAAVYEAGNIGSISYIASTYCAGGSLADLLRNRQAIGDGGLEFRFDRGTDRGASRRCPTCT